MHLDFKYADLLDDLAFKLVFGQESTKNVMIEFLNQVITDRKIVDVEFADKEIHPNIRDRKTSIYDLLCMTDDGSRIIVELQKRKQDSYAERMLYYSMHQILKQVESGASSFDFCPIYVISILNFTLDQNDSIADVKTVYRLLEETHNTLLTDRLTYIFIELPKFKKSAEELTGDVLEGMYFCLKNMSQLQERPIALTHGIFDKIFGISELLVMDEDTRDKIIENMTTERDLKNQLDYARKVAIAEGLAEGKAQGMEQGMAQGMAQGMEQGMAQGMAQEKLQIAKNMLAMGLDTETISKATGLSVDEIDNL
jgi:predicted transposase/invertase (TIGR01784 family)